jgi:hypothetical protein
MIILEPGDQDTRHNVSKSHFRKGSFQIVQADPSGLNEEFRLMPWLKWMEKADFDGMWGKTI